jgi:hypothetical protein
MRDKAEQVLLGSLGERGVEVGCRGQWGEMTQTMYADVNK